ncbi:hypothetical protein IFM89_014513 [Coptis chinensis]|uniref:Protein kinase domain-containing protein n=1 Tax=Coptis chinensis TaxID=261450 RepID=A0A835LMI7_9MAGN|nr:hypothetical protein IFM89_014513 [Coptis chinensis]
MATTVSNIEAVLEFLRENGLKEAETALKQDITHLGSFDFEKFEFPMSPKRPPPVRIALDHRRFEDDEVFKEGSGSSDDSSSDDFLSMGSFSIHGSPSGFTNPYGIRTMSRLKSDASSADFGTARDYHDSDILNDMYWYGEKGEDYLKHSYFGRADLLGCPSEDKFVTPSEAEGTFEEPSGLNFASEGFHSETSFTCLDKSCPLNNTSMDYEDGFKVKDRYHWDETIQPKQALGEVLSDRVFILESEKGLNRNLNEEEFQQESDSNLVVAKNSSPPHRDDEHERADSEEKVGESQDPGTAGDGEECNTPNELSMYNSQEDEYEVFNLRIIHRKNRTGFEENKDLPIVLNTTIASRYYVTEYIGSAAFSKVVQAHDLHMGVDVCLKIIKNDKDFFDQSLDEIKLLKFVNKHDPADDHHILRLYDYFYHREHLFIVCELLRANLYEFLKYNQDSGGEAYFSLHRLQIITRQCLEALEYLHHLGIIHCDLKPENILIKSYSRCEIKIIDLGSSCFQTDNLCLYVQSRSYRAPEVILGLPYDPKIDIWSFGCILAELCSGDVLFPNEGLVTLLERMIGMFGPIDMEMLVKGQETHKYFTKDYENLYHINEETNQLVYMIPEELSLENHLKVSDIGFVEFVKCLLQMNPSRRPTASEALQHPWLSYQYD